MEILNTRNPVCQYSRPICKLESTAHTTAKLRESAYSKRTIQNNR